MLTSPPRLQPYLGKNIGQLCPFSLGKDNTQNHCAHFVSHIMGYEQFAVNCRNQTSADKQIPGKGVAIRVDEIFNVTPDRDLWGQRPGGLTSCLIFVTITSNMIRAGNQLRMQKNPSKHIGFFIDDVVWHYSNGQDKVVKEHVILFVKKFYAEYRKYGQPEFFYGRFLK